MSDIFVDNIKHQSSQGSGTITLGASGEKINLGADAGGTITARPAFEAHLSATQTVSDAVFTKVQSNTEVFDTDSCYDNSTNYRFTPTVAGKYFVYGKVMTRAGATSLENGIIEIRKNGSSYVRQQIDLSSNRIDNNCVQASAVIDMNGSSDYVELWGRTATSGATSEFYGASGATYKFTGFGAYRLIGA